MSKQNEITPELARRAVDAILSMMEWAGNVSDQYLDSDPNQRRQLVEDRTAAREVVRDLNHAIAFHSGSPEGQ